MPRIHRSAANFSTTRGSTKPEMTLRARLVLSHEAARPGDTVLVKGSRGVGLEVVAESLAANG